MPPLEAVRAAAAPPLANGSVPVMVEEPSAIVNPKPVAPPVSVPTEANDDMITLEANVAPVNVPAGAITAAVVIDVVRPLALMVTIGMAVDDPEVPELATVANVSTPVFEIVASPVIAASIAMLLTLPTNICVLVRLKLDAVSGVPFHTPAVIVPEPLRVKPGRAMAAVLYVAPVPRIP